jgi:very-short-patch-repair endonuclease
LKPKLIVELDGGQHGSSKAYDENRDALHAGAGLRRAAVLEQRSVNADDAVRERILQALQAPRGPHPSPLPQAGEEQEKTGDFFKP